jgi:sulfide:quinone oxidoreductase
MNSDAHVVILGAGFAALAAAATLRKRRPDARIRLVAPARTFLYRPSLIWIPVGLRKRKQIEIPLRRFFEQHRLEFTPAHVTGLADGGRTVLTDRGKVRNGALIVATGTAFLDDVPGLSHTLPLCESARAAEAIHERLTALSAGRIAIGCGSNPRDAAAARVSPMLELAFGVDTWLRTAGRRERFELTFFSPVEQPAKRLGDSAVDHIWARLDQCDIDVRTGERVREFHARSIRFEGGTLDADLVVYTPGLTGPAWLADSGLPRSDGGFLAADEYCAVPGFEHVYAAGDVGHFPGPAWSPKLGHMAQLQGQCAALNLAAALAGEPPPSRLRHELACVVDTLDGGILVYRDDGRSVALPSSLPMHWAKRAVERRFLARLGEPV